MRFSIRPARAEDLEPCAALYDRVAREVFTWFPDTDRRAQFLAEAAEEEVFVAEQGGRILALASFYRPDNYLHSLYVERDARRQGVGLALLGYVRAEAAGPVSLKVQKLNTAAIAFYRAQGMNTVGDGGSDEPGGGWLRLSFNDLTDVK